MVEIVPTWSMAPVVDAFQAMRGVGFVAAVVCVAELGDLPRFDHLTKDRKHIGRLQGGCGIASISRPSVLVPGVVLA